MENPSEANDEGVTALHNSICAGHFDVVKFLVDFGCDVNAADADGWLVILVFLEVFSLHLGRNLQESDNCHMYCVLLNSVRHEDWCNQIWVYFANQNVKWVLATL